MKPLNELGISPAPWKLETTSINDRDGECVANACTWNAKAIADATLLAAAPVMYGAAYDMCYREGYTNCRHCDDFPDCHNCPYRNLRLVLEIASGGVIEASDEVKDWEAQ